MEDGFPKLPGNAYTQNIVGMAIIGLMMVVLTHAFGHSYVDGVGYGVIQAILTMNMTTVGLLALLFVAEDARHHDQPRFGRLGRHLLAFALSRRDARGRLRRARRRGSSAHRPDHPFGGDRRHGGDGRAQEPAA